MANLASLSAPLVDKHHLIHFALSQSSWKFVSRSWSSTGQHPANFPWMHFSYIQGITLSNEQLEFARRKRHRRKNDQLDSLFCRQISHYSASAHRSHSKTSMAGKWDQGVDGRVLGLHSAGFKYRQIQKILSENGFERSLGYISNVVNCKGKNRLASAKGQMHQRCRTKKDVPRRDAQSVYPPRQGMLAHGPHHRAIPPVAKRAARNSLPEKRWNTGQRGWH